MKTNQIPRLPDYGFIRRMFIDLERQESDKWDHIFRTADEFRKDLHYLATRPIADVLKETPVKP